MSRQAPFTEGEARGTRKVLPHATPVDRAEMPEFSGIDEQTFSGFSPSSEREQFRGAPREGSHVSLLHAR